MGKILDLHIIAPGDPSAGISDATWTIEEVFDPYVYDDESQAAAREDVRAAFREAFILIIDGGFDIIFSDELMNSEYY